MIGQQQLDAFGASGTDARRLFEAPMPIVSEKRARFGRQVLAHLEPIAGTTAAYMRGDQPVIVVDGDGGVGRTQPQLIADQRERHGIQHALMADVAVSMNRHLVPRTQVGSEGRQCAHQLPLDLEQFELDLAGGAVDAVPRFGLARSVAAAFRSRSRIRPWACKKRNPILG